MSRFIRTISQSVSTLAVFNMLATGVAVADPTTTLPAATTTTAAATGAPTSSTTDLNGTAIDSDDVAQGGPLSDVPQGHWAYDAVAQLVKDGLIKGYPDGTFKGKRPMTRYEAAVLTYRAVDQIEAQIAAGRAVSQADIDAAKKLLAAFGKELKAVETHVDALQKQVDGVKAEADATQLRVNQGKVGLLFQERPGTSFSNMSVINGGPTTQFGATPGNAIRGGQGQLLTAPLGSQFAFGPGGLNTSPIGPQNHGVNYTYVYLLFGGQIDPRWSYGARLSDILANENGLGNTTVAPSLCTVTTTTNCSFSDLNNGSNTNPLNLDYAYLQYSSPGGITSQLGRYAVGEFGRYTHFPDNLLFSGRLLRGLNVGYNDPHGHVYAQVYYAIPSVSTSQLSTNGNLPNAGQGVCSQNIVGLNYASNSLLPGAQGQFNNVNPYCNATQSEIGAWVLYYFSGPRIAIGGSTDTFVARQYTFYNPSAVNCTVKGTVLQAASPNLCVLNGGTYIQGAAQGNYLTELTNPQAVEAYASFYFGPSKVPTFNVQVSAAKHLGVNPFTGGAYGQSLAYSGSLTYASKGNVFSTGSNNNPFFAGGGRKDSNVAQISYEYYGLNSLGGIDTGNFSGTPVPFNNIGYGVNPNGLYFYLAEIGHWFSDSVRLSVFAYHLQNNRNIPVGTNGSANSCAGCFVNLLQQNQVNAEMMVYFF